jgi:hypothetical protein
VAIRKEAIKRILRETVSNRWVLCNALDLQIPEYVADTLSSSGVGELCMLLKVCNKSPDFKERLLPLVTHTIRSVIDYTHPIFQGLPTNEFTDDQKLELWVSANTPNSRQLTAQYIQTQTQFDITPRCVKLLTKYWFDDPEMRRVLIEKCLVKKDTYTRLVFEKCPDQWRTEIPRNWWSEIFFDIGRVLPVVPTYILKDLFIPRHKQRTTITREWTMDLVKAIPTDWHTLLHLDSDISDNFRDEIKEYISEVNFRNFLARQCRCSMTKLIEYTVLIKEMTQRHVPSVFLDDHIGHADLSSDQYNHLLTLRLKDGQIDGKYHGEWYAAALRSGCKPPEWLVLTLDNQLHASLFKLFVNTYPRQVLTRLPENVKAKIRHEYNAIELE